MKISKLFRRLRIKSVGLLYLSFLRLNKRVQLGKDVRFYKIPSISVQKGTQLIIGDNVTINSDNWGYHINMHSRCKILLDRVGAKIYIGNNCRIHGSCLHAYKKISIGSNCLIAANSNIIDGNGHDLSFNDVSNRINTQGDSKEIIIGNNVWIGANVIVLPGVTIGNGSVISANSVVHKNIPPMVLAGGNPIQIIKEY